MQKKSYCLLFFCMLLATASFAAKPAPAFSKQRPSGSVKPMVECETFSFTPSCRTTPGSITVCGSSSLWETFWAYVGAAMENEAVACPPEDPGPFGHMVW